MSLLLIVAVTCALAALYCNVRKCNNYWNERGVRTVKTNFIFGTVYDFVTGRCTFKDTFNRIYRAAPDEPYVGVYSLLKPVLFIRDPELIHQITVKDFRHFADRGEEAVTAEGPLDQNVFSLRGAKWKIQRSKLNPVFSSGTVNKKYGLMQEYVHKMMEDRLGPAAKKHENVDVQDIMTCFSLDVMGSYAFGLQFNTLKESDSDCRKIAHSISDFSTWRIALWYLLRAISPKVVRWLRYRHLTQTAEKFFFTLLRDAEEQRREESHRREDLLQLMFNLRDGGDEIGRLFTDDHIASNMYAVFFGAFDSTRNSIAYVLYELARNQEIQEKLRNEIKKAKEGNNGIMDLDTVLSIQYLEMVISETLRLHSVIPIYGRRCVKTYQIPGSTLKIESGVDLIIPIAALHADEKYFPHPEKFHPERFSEKNIDQRNAYTYQPFGRGPRMCIGYSFGKLEMKVCLAEVLMRFKFTSCSRTEDPILLDVKSFSCSPKNGIWLSVEISL